MTSLRLQQFNHEVEMKLQSGFRILIGRDNSSMLIKFYALISAIRRLKINVGDNMIRPAATITYDSTIDDQME